MSQKYIVEHLEPRIYRWCEIEYENISKMVGKSNLIFTNIKRGGRKLAKFGKVMSVSVKNLKLNNACVLDPKAKKTLEPKEALHFKYFIFGGILGDHPPKKRTKKELTTFIKNAEARNIGKKQFSTDNAIYVVKEIAGGKKLEEIKFRDGVEIRINKIESVILPYRYPVINGKPQMSQKIINYLRRKKSF